MFDIDYKKVTQKRISWLKQTVEKAGFSHTIIAVSGGIDSAVCLYLAIQALGKENTYAALLPCGALSKQATADGKNVVFSAGLADDHLIQRDIQSVVEKIMRHDKEKADHKIRKGNIMARVRMTFLYDLAKEKNALVIGTENKSEYHLGYFTRFGDEASDIEPIRDLYKTHVRGLAQYLAIPQEIITRPPSAGLWDGQTDEHEFGFSYNDADQILYAFFEKKLSVEQIIALGFSKRLIEKVLQRVQTNDFKHHLPYVFYDL